MSSVRTALTCMVLTAEAKDDPRIILCLVYVGFLLLVVGGAIIGVSGADVMTATGADT